MKSFGNGSEALECIKEKYPDLVICDLMLHGMYGYELSSRLKTSGETSVIPIILYGSRIDIGQRKQKRKFPGRHLFICAFPHRRFKDRNECTYQKQPFSKKIILADSFRKAVLGKGRRESFR